MYTYMYIVQYIWMVHLQKNVFLAMLEVWNTDIEV